MIADIVIGVAVCILAAAWFADRVALRIVIEEQARSIEQLRKDVDSSREIPRIRTSKSMVIPLDARARTERAAARRNQERERIG